MAFINNIHINRPTGHYIGQVRAYGRQKWKTITEECSTMEHALACAAEWMHTQHRLRVLFIDDSGYYEPNIIFEGSR